MQRRAENMIWNAAGRYDFDPPFMAFTEKGKPDPYFNLVIGFAAKWLDLDQICAFFASYAGSRKAEEFDELMWLGIENCVYEKEVAERPILAALRKERAQQFYKNRQTLSRQQMMLQSMTVYDQQQARWSKVLGQKGDPLSPSKRDLAKALEIPGSVTTKELIARLTAILQQYFHYTIGNGREEERRTPVTGKAAKILRRVLRREDQVRDTLLMRTGTGTGDADGAAQLSHSFEAGRSAEQLKQDEAYIRKAFGDCTLTEQQLRVLENGLCAGAHADCRLWVTDSRDRHTGAGAAGSGDPARNEPEVSGNKAKQNADTASIGSLNRRDDRELDKMLDDAGKQAGKNRRYLEKRSMLIQSGIKRLSARLDEVLSSYERALPEEAKAGRLEPEKAWRLPALRDPEVFTRAGEETERSLTVDLLLDASASRLNYQEELASQAYSIARSFQACGVPVQVLCFRSLRGYTVLQILKDRKEHDCSRILGYFAGGWNRDGLGIRLAGSLAAPKTDAARRILFVLTDASPNDSTRIPAGEGLLSKEYQGKAAVLDTKQAVDDLREQGIEPAAIFLGPTLYLENLHTIYQGRCVRIHRIEQLEEAVSSLLDQTLRQSR